MNDGNKAQKSWRTSDGSPWWLRSTRYSEPNGDYHASCYLDLWHKPKNEDSVTWNDGSCSYHAKSYYCQLAEVSLTPKAGSPTGCVCEKVALTGKYSAKVLIQCKSCLDVRKKTQKNSCPKGTKLFSPASRADWKVFIDSAKPLRSPHWIIDVTRPQNGCGGCTGSPMNVGVPSQRTWGTSDGSPWWLRSSRYSEPNGDYHANCYLDLWHTPANENSVTWNDGNCNYHANSYYCQLVKPKPKPVKPKTVKESCSVTFFYENLADGKDNRDIKKNFDAYFGDNQYTYDVAYSHAGGSAKVKGAVHTFRDATLKFQDANNIKRSVKLIDNSGAATVVSNLRFSRGCAMVAIPTLAIKTGFGPTSGIYRSTPKKQNGRNIFAGPNGAFLHYEVKGSSDGNNWAANNFIKANGWTIGQGGHHRYALATTDTPEKLCGRAGFKMRVSATLPIDISGCQNFPGMAMAIIIKTAFEPTSGTYKPNGKEQNKLAIYAGPNGAILHYEVKGSTNGNNWAADNFIKADGWTIGQGGHHRYALATKDDELGNLRGKKGWKVRVNAKLPIDIIGGPPPVECAGMAGNYEAHSGLPQITVSGSIISGKWNNGRKAFSGKMLESCKGSVKFPDDKTYKFSYKGGVITWSTGKWNKAKNAMALNGNGCCRFSGWKAKNQGYTTETECKARCLKDYNCIAADLARPKGGKSNCYLFYGSGKNFIRQCGTSDPTQKCFRKA